MRGLFTTIDGRIDLGIVIAGKGPAAFGGFLGFDAADLEVIRYEPAAPDWRDASALSVGGALG
jgi:hypothetical protein